MRNGSLVFNQPLAAPPDDGKLRLVVEQSETQPLRFLSFICPGCGFQHTYIVGTAENVISWHWNGSMSLPTFYPSMRVRGRGSVCHFFVTNGEIAFEPDSTHELSGKKVMLPEIK